MLSKVVALAAPTLMVLMTVLADTWKGTQTMVNRLRDYLRRDGIDLAMAWAVEPNPSGKGTHLHGWAYGAGLRPAHFRDRAHQVGFGWASTKRITYYGDTGYLWKNATWNEASLAAHLALNNNDMVAMKGFARDARSGQALTLRSALVVARSTPHEALRALYGTPTSLRALDGSPQSGPQPLLGVATTTAPERSRSDSTPFFGIAPRRVMPDLGVHPPLALPAGA